MGKFVGERRAVAAAVVGFYMSIYFLVSLQAPAGWAGAFAGLAGTYAVGFVGLVAGYFWARWYVIGLGISGLTIAGMTLWQVGPEPVIVFYGATHALASLALWGVGVAGLFDGRTEWRERFHLDESATHRLGKSVIRVGVSLPYFVVYALAPKEGGAALGLAALGLAALGFYGLARLRTWGVGALGASAGALALALATGGCGCHVVTASGFGFAFALPMVAAGAVALVMTLGATLPFARPAVRYLRAHNE
jgi:hypothetical protein